MSIIVICPHSGQQIPPEIRLSQLNPHAIHDMVKAIDAKTDELYNIGYDQFIFPYLRSIIDVNQHPDDLDDAVPIETNSGLKIYDKEPDRQKLLKYHHRFHEMIQESFKSKLPTLILDCHSTFDGARDDHGDRFSGDITISNFQRNRLDRGSTKSCSDEILKYIENRLSKYWEVKTNTDYLVNTYGYIEELYSKTFNIPVLCIEMNERVYMDDIEGAREKLKECLS